MRQPFSGIATGGTKHRIRFKASAAHYGVCPAPHNWCVEAGIRPGYWTSMSGMHSALAAKKLQAHLYEDGEEIVMTERLVDVDAPGPRTLHTFPVSIDDAKADDQSFKEKALEGAAHAGLVPKEELAELDAKMHLCRGGPMEPYGDRLGVLAETKEGLEQAVRERAYALWEKSGNPDDKAEEFWYRAQLKHFRERAYALWEQEGCPEGKADEHWYRIRAFEEI
jgi:hypothetical protein